MAECCAGTPQCSATQDKTVAICSPAPNGGETSPVQITAVARDNEHPITGMVAYANSQIIAESPDAVMNALVSLSPGNYNLVIRAWDTTGYYFSSQETFTVTGHDGPQLSQNRP